MVFFCGRQRCWRWDACLQIERVELRRVQRPGQRRRAPVPHLVAPQVCAVMHSSHTTARTELAQLVVVGHGGGKIGALWSSDGE